MQVVSVLASVAAAKHAFSKAAVDGRAAVRRSDRVGVRLPKRVSGDVLKPTVAATTGAITARLVMGAVVDAERLCPPSDASGVAGMACPSRVPITLMETASLAYAVSRVLAFYIAGIRLASLAASVPRLGVRV